MQGMVIITWEAEAAVAVPRVLELKSKAAWAEVEAAGTALLVLQEQPQQAQPTLEVAAALGVLMWLPAKLERQAAPA